MLHSLPNASCIDNACRTVLHLGCLISCGLAYDLDMRDGECRGRKVFLDNPF